MDHPSWSTERLREPTSHAVRHAQYLRAIGTLLDRERAQDVMIEESPSAITVSWGGPGGQTKTAAYRWADLESLDTMSIEYRTSETPSRITRDLQGGGWAQLLRSMGQDLDGLHVPYCAVSGDLEALTASWMADGFYASRHYTAAELWDADRRRAVRRQPTG
jgi:hypothetical protein